MTPRDKNQTKKINKKYASHRDRAFQVVWSRAILHRLRQVDYKFKTGLGYRASFRKTIY